MLLPLSLRRQVAPALAVAGVLAVASAAQAAPPPNDFFVAATPITGSSGSVDGTNGEATKEPGEPAHGGDAGGRSVWYRWTSPFSGSVRMDTCGASFDTLLAAYTGDTVASLTRLASSDDVCNAASQIVFPVTSGQEYRIAVDGYEGATGSFALRWQPDVPPPNDAFAAAQPLSGTTGEAAGSNAGASSEPGEPRHEEEAGGRSIWFAWTAPVSGTGVFRTCGSLFNTVLAVYAGDAISRLVALARNDNTSLCGRAGSAWSSVSFPAAAGTTYRIAVDGRNGAAGTVTLAWAMYRPPANDAFGGARRIGGIGGRVAGSNVGATQQAREARHGGPGGASVWFRWRAPVTGLMRFATCGASFDTLLGVYGGRTFRSLRLVDSDDDGCDPGSVATAIVVRGRVYHIVVDGYGGDLGTFALKWNLAPCTVPSVVGLTLARATGALRSAGCAVGQVDRIASRLVPRGRVVAQLPSPGQRRPARSRVRLEVSGGPD